MILSPCDIYTVVHVLIHGNVLEAAVQVTHSYTALSTTTHLFVEYILSPARQLISSQSSVSLPLFTPF